MAGREYHRLTHANANINRESQLADDVWSYQPYATGATLYMLVPGTSFTARADWYYNFEYLREKERGLDFHEDLFTPGVFTISLQAGAQLTLIVSTENPIGRNAENLLAGERARRKNLISVLPIADDLTRALSLAADQLSSGAVLI